MLYYPQNIRRILSTARKEVNMFPYTTAAYTYFINILKKVCKTFQIALSVFTLVYLTFALVTKIGIFPINLTLLVLSIPLI